MPFGIPDFSSYPLPVLANTAVQLHCEIEEDMDLKKRCQVCAVSILASLEHKKNTLRALEHELYSRIDAEPHAILLAEIEIMSALFQRYAAKFSASVTGGCLECSRRFAGQMNFYMEEFIALQAEHEHLYSYI
jgi:hypothetical protein